MEERQKTIANVAKEITKIKNTDYWEVLNEYKNIWDPLLVRIFVEEEQTGTEYTYEREEDQGKNPYAGGYYLLQVYFGDVFPTETPPTVLFRTPILHANVSMTDGYICLDALNKWNVSITLSKTSNS